MIIVLYKRKTYDHATNTHAAEVLGKETHEHIGEVLIPRNPDANSPIFITKKFLAHAEYRWKVVRVVVGQPCPGSSQTFEVFVEPSPQLLRGEYLSNILKTPGKTISNVLHRYALVEVEYGHPLAVGKINSDIRTNKRYADSLQYGSMPKRRLAIINRVSSYGMNPVIQAIPISSVPPRSGDNSSVEVTGSLASMVHYNKQSWAVTSMIETIAPTRIIAPLVQWNKKAIGRDTGFRTRLEPKDRVNLLSALMYGVNSESRLRDTADLLAAREDVKKHEGELAQLRQQVSMMQSQATYFSAYEQMAKEYAEQIGQKFDLLRDEYVTVYGNS